MTYYHVLGVDNTATERDIKKAYHQMIIAFHPDKYKGDPEFATKKTHDIIEAYQVLRQPETRKAYDALLYSQAHPAATTPAQKSGQDDESKTAYFHTVWRNLKHIENYKILLSVAGLAFIIFAVILFISIIVNI